METMSPEVARARANARFTGAFPPGKMTGTKDTGVSMYASLIAFESKREQYWSKTFTAAIVSGVLLTVAIIMFFTGQDSNNVMAAFIVATASIAVVVFYHEKQKESRRLSTMILLMLRDWQCDTCRGSPRVSASGKRIPFCKFFSDQVMHDDSCKLRDARPGETWRSGNVAIKERDILPSFSSRSFIVNGNPAGTGECPLN